MSTVIFPPQKQAPAHADTINHRLLIQAGFVRQVMAGVYAYSELGLTVLNRISQIVRDKMIALGSSELLMPGLQPAENWKKTGGWDKIDVLFKIKSQTGKDYALGQSHEEIVTPLLAEVIQSYQDLPQSVFQIQWKYRDELRAKSGILRGREFLMKDMYSFHRDEADFLNYYEKVKAAYLEIFAELGLTAKVTEASGGSFSEKISYEFMVLTAAGEDDVWYCDDCDYCINAEIAPAELVEKGICPKCGAPLQQGRASEAGNVFDLGDKFTRVFELTFTDEKNQKHYPLMGCYGIGISRALGLIVEKHHDEQGIIWPASVAPAQVYLLGLGSKHQVAEALAATLTAAGVTVIWDDRDLSPGAKFAAADLIGCPYRLVVSDKTGDQIEVKARGQTACQLVAPDKLLTVIK